MTTLSGLKDVGGDNLVRDVFGLLDDANVKLNTTEQVLTKLPSKHAKTTGDLKGGQDVTKATIKARDEKIAKLTYRVRTLEAEIEAENGMMKYLQSEVQTGEQSNPRGCPSIQV